MKEMNDASETSIQGPDKFSLESEAAAVKENNWYPKTALVRWLAAILLFCFISALSIVVYDRCFSTRIVSIDIKGFIAAQRDLYVQGKISDEQLKRNIDSLERTLQKIPANVVVIMGDAVVKNAEVIKP